MTEFSNWARLAEPFPEDELQWLVVHVAQDKASGLVAPFIDARTVMDRLDQVMGPDNWRDSYALLGKTTLCTLSLRFPTDDGTGLEWLEKSDGAGETEFEGEKGAISASFKRAAVKWGIGRYLYSLPAQWAPVEAKGKGHQVKTPPKLPAWALPAPRQKPAAPPTAGGGPPPAGSSPAAPGPRQEPPQTPEPAVDPNKVLSDEQRRFFLNRLAEMRLEYGDTYDRAIAEMTPKDPNTIVLAQLANSYVKMLRKTCEALKRGTGQPRQPGEDD